MSDAFKANLSEYLIKVHNEIWIIAGRKRYWTLGLKDTNIQFLKLIYFQCNFF